MKRNQFLDVARGIGMMLVIIGHSVGLSNYLTYFFIQLFFVISGCLYKPGRSYGENIRKKAKRVLIPYFGYSASLLLFYALSGRSLQETKFSAIGILYSRFCLYNSTMYADADNVFFLNIANGGLWFLTTFFVTSLIFHLLANRCRKSNKYLAGCIVVLTLITIVLAELPILFPWGIDTAFAGAIFMLAGQWLSQIGFFEKKWNIWWILAVFFCYVLITTINTGLNTSVREYGLYGRWSVPFYILIGISGSILCIWTGKLVQKTILGSFLAYIGQNTMILLAYHILGLEIFSILAGRFLDLGNLTGIAFVLYHIVRIAASIVGCLILEKIIGIGSRIIKKLWKREA